MLTHDIRQAIRAWRRAPVVAVATILMIAIGVAANAAVFGVAQAVLFRPLPYPAADRLVEVFESSPAISEPLQTFRASPLNYLSWAERSRTLDALAAFQGTAFVVAGDGSSQAERVPGTAVTPSLFRVLGVEPVMGRELRPEDQVVGGPRVALVSQGFWQRRFGGDRSIVGKSLTLDGERYEIVGVVPNTFHEVGRSLIGADTSAQLFVPLVMDPSRETRGNRVLRVAGRLKPGVSLAQANADIGTIAKALGAEFPATNAGWGARVAPVAFTMLDENIRPALLTLLGAIGAVMFIAATNVAALLLATTMARMRELALRTALGASRRQLQIQVLTESLCMTVVSGVLGVMLTFALGNALRSLLPADFPRVNEVRFDAGVFAFGFAMAVLSGVLAGVIPASRVTAFAQLAPLMHGGKGSVGTSSGRFREALVIGQVAVATLLFVVGGLLFRSFVGLQHVPLGFDPSSVTTARIGLPRATFSDPERMTAFYQRVLEALSNDSEVASVAVATSAPFAPGVRRGVTVRTSSAEMSVAEHIVSSDYFRVLRIPMLAGGSFDGHDRGETARAVVISSSVARALWPERIAVGQFLERDRQQYEVVGVVGDVRGDSDQGSRGGGRDVEPRPAIYLSTRQLPQRTLSLIVRTRHEPDRIGIPLVRRLATIDPMVPTDQVRPLEAWVADSVANPRLTTAVSTAFAVVAFLLAAVGIYGMVAYGVEQRRGEFGVRLAVGASPGDVRVMVLRQGLRTALVGAAAGLVVALGLGRVLRNLLFDVAPNDAVTFASVAVLLGFVSALACYLPARRAAGTDPVIALRSN